MWRLVYTSFDSLENTHANAVQTQNHPLGLASGGSATTFSEAVRRAKAAWVEVSAVTYEGWDRVVYPHSPRLVWSKPLEEL